MTNTFFIIKDIYNEEIRISADDISKYKATSHYTTITLKSGLEVNVQFSPEYLDQMLIESYFMVKKIV